MLCKLKSKYITFDTNPNAIANTIALIVHSMTAAIKSTPCNHRKRIETKNGVFALFASFLSYSIERSIVF